MATTDIDRATPAPKLRVCDALKPSHLTKPPGKFTTVSAATVYKRQKLETLPLHPSPRSVHKSTVKSSGKMRQKERIQPLVLAFKETSEGYRRQLFSTAVPKLNKTLDTLLDKLYENNLQSTSSDAANSSSRASPLKLTVPAKYQRTVQKLCSPLSGYRYSLQRMNAMGETERLQTTLHDRFQSFERHVQAETQQIKELQRQWEGVVADIFQLGVACLGENGIAALLSSAETDADVISQNTEAGSTLFVPEYGGSVHTGKEKEKRVSFAVPDTTKLFPEFLFHAARLQRKPVPIATQMPIEEVHALEERLAGLGKQPLADLQRLEKEDQQWWKKKQNQLAHSFMQD